MNELDARARILDEVVGFGKPNLNPATMRLYEVTNNLPSGPGSLALGASVTGNWCVFRFRGAFNQTTNVKPVGGTVIDGIGVQGDAPIEVRKYGIWINSDSRPTADVLVLGLTFPEISGSDDAVQIRGTATERIAFGHCTFGHPDFPIRDGMFDVTVRAKATLFNSLFVREAGSSSDSKAILLGGAANDAASLTMYGNYLNGIQQRGPLVRGRLHSFNNYRRGWQLYGIGAGSSTGEVLTDTDIFEYGQSSGSHSMHAFVDWEADAARTNPLPASPARSVKAINPLFIGNTSGQQKSPELCFTPSYDYLSAFEHATQAQVIAFRDRIVARAGNTRTFTMDETPPTGTDPRIEELERELAEQRLVASQAIADRNLANTRVVTLKDVLADIENIARSGRA